MVFQREKQHVAATELLQNLANQHDLHLNQCVITGLLDINRLFTPAESFQTHTLVVTETPDNREINLPQSIIFDKCIFEENVVFSAPWLQPDSLKVKFENEVVFNRSRFKGQARFRNATFHKSAGFDGCAFDGVVTFKNASFEQEAKFRTVE
ncbi:MAG: pentapeptide repeat-containing protein, partial [Planctomycetota bacterium]